MKITLEAIGDKFIVSSDCELQHRCGPEDPQVRPATSADRSMKEAVISDLNQLEESHARSVYQKLLALIFGGNASVLIECENHRMAVVQLDEARIHLATNQETGLPIIPVDHAGFIESQYRRVFGRNSI